MDHPRITRHTHAPKTPHQPRSMRFPIGWFRSGSALGVGSW